MKLPYEECQEIAKTHSCAVCDGELVTRWNQAGSFHEVVCSKGCQPEEFRRQLTLSERHRQGEALPQGIANTLERRRSKMPQNETSVIEFKGKQFALLADAHSLTLVPREVMISFLNYCDTYQLDPRASHACIYRGVPYCTIDGSYNIAHRSGDFGGISSKPLTSKEKTALGFETTDIVWEARARRKGIDEPFVGYGRVTKKELEALSRDKTGPRHPILVDNPQRMCEKRAEKQALRKAFPLIPRGIEELLQQEEQPGGET